MQIINKNEKLAKILFIVLVFLCLTSFVSPPLALILGVLVAWFIGHPFLEYNGKAIHFLLKASVVGLGFGMNATSAIKAGKEGIIFTIISIISTMVFGFLLGKLLKVEKKTSYLISSGTAICGGSAIAAISPVIKAKEHQISVALGVVFILNAIALLVFPVIGHWLQLSQQQFGLWCAIAIHDTSSVVGASGSYGDEALQVATTVKLARALWIIPLAFLSTFLFKNRDTKVKIPYFIGLFVLAMITNTYIPVIQLVSPYLVVTAKAGLTLTLFLIGCSLSLKVIKTVGVKPLIQGLLLWIFISCIALWVVSCII
ncbi:putative sulfate exporter family transporter [Flavobacterium arcticum]|uniref:Putative sulfate exporter family transporter n=1 Tax=Flavobacterium arcticum TaxID=1784713 RepID=A0A345HEK7_9FLAO|nr:putative sulfate exporter family transporter [Flavobacterium arcticum]AXG75017.1 putative sulfate exporter family transporter [Flavobacterium arcticum]KAF2506569.1 putative sulfate exporter family transporter [Flavobacterium arcticum]